MPHIALQQFVKLNTNERSVFLHKNGRLLDYDVEKDVQVNLYSVQGFFAEEILSVMTLEVMDVIPFHKGYSLELLAELNRR